MQHSQSKLRARSNKTGLALVARNLHCFTINPMAYWIHVGLIALIVLLPQTRGASDWPLPQARPEKAGFSQERLEKMHGLIRSYIDQGKHAGAIAVIARNGKLVD